MTYRIEFERSAEKDLLSLPPLLRERIGAALEKLARDPINATNVKALRGGGYRLRVGDYRVLYTLRLEVLILFVVRIAHRKDVYRD